jgi:hypothetical protein
LGIGVQKEIEMKFNHKTDDEPYDDLNEDKNTIQIEMTMKEAKAFGYSRDPMQDLVNIQKGLDGEIVKIQEHHERMRPRAAE